LGHGHTTIKLELPLLVDATFCAGSAMIAFGAVLGKTTPTQLTWLMIGLVSYFTDRITSCCYVFMLCGVFLLQIQGAP
jgi:hypothetical protein